jgi:hypothetical protein
MLSGIATQYGCWRENVEQVIIQKRTTSNKVDQHVSLNDEAAPRVRVAGKPRLNRYLRNRHPTRVALPLPWCHVGSPASESPLIPSPIFTFLILFIFITLPTINRSLASC